MILGNFKFYSNIKNFCPLYLNKIIPFKYNLILFYHKILNTDVVKAADELEKIIEARRVKMNI